MEPICGSSCLSLGRSSTSREDFSPVERQLIERLNPKVFEPELINQDIAICYKSNLEEKQRRLKNILAYIGLCREAFGVRCSHRFFRENQG